MTMYRLHRGVSRALDQVIRITHRRTPATRDRAEGSEAAEHGWTLPAMSQTNIEMHAAASWRRRLLLGRGEQIHITSVERADRCAIAILDARGIVVAWHDHLPHANASDRGVVSRHMSQFYVAEDVALYLPARHLSIAAEHGIDTQRGWRCRPGGEIFWGVTVIQSILLSDGELLGYSHMTRLVRGPALHLSRSMYAGLPQTACHAMMA